MRSIKEPYSGFEVVRSQIGRIQFHYTGRKLSKEDTALMRFFFGAQYALLLDLLPDSPKAERLFRGWLFGLTTVDLFKLGTFLKCIDNQIKTYLFFYETQQGKGLTLSEFKQQIGKDGYWGFISPMYEILSSYLSDPTPGQFSILSQWINLGIKINLKSIDLKRASEIEYIDFEVSMATWEYEPLIIKEIRSVLTEWVSNLDFSDFYPKHGPGAIAETKGRPNIAEKFCYLGTDCRLEYLRKLIGPLEDFNPLHRSFKFERCSEIVCVPKSMTSNRTISKEPATLQYYQQGIFKVLDEWANTEMYEHIRLHQQEYSADLAREGSIWGEYATIDLSNASDSISWDLIKRVLGGTDLYRALLCTRSTHTKLPSGRKLKLNKFAPMGSACCFPIETLIFAACCEVVCRRLGRKYKYVVYGDDMVIHQNCVVLLLEVLESLHFKVNTSKSFHSSCLLNFREACGGEYFNGKEVTPLRFSRRLDKPFEITMSEPEEFSRYISLANNAYERGFRALRLTVLHELMLMLGNERFNLIRFTSSCNTGLALRTENETISNYKLQWRRNYSLQKPEVKALDLKTRPRKVIEALSTDELEIVKYYLWIQRYGREGISDRVKLLTGISLDERFIDIWPRVEMLGSRWISSTY